MNLLIAITTLKREGWGKGLASMVAHASNPVPPLIFDDSMAKIGPVPAMQRIYQETTEPILAYFHDDVLVHEEGWDSRVLAEFDDPEVGVAGFGGSLWHGAPDIYKVPYHISQLGRSYYMSNTDDAETHGGRFDGACDVATLDGFCLIIRRELLDKIGGWAPDNWPPHHVYDHRVTLMAHRHGYKVRLVGVKCMHLGGQTVVGQAYLDFACSTVWGSDENMHTQGHRMIYEEFRDVLPVLLQLGRVT